MGDPQISLVYHRTSQRNRMIGGTLYDLENLQISASWAPSLFECTRVATTENLHRHQGQPLVVHQKKAACCLWLFSMARNSMIKVSIQGCGPDIITENTCNVDETNWPWCVTEMIFFKLHGTHHCQS